MAPTKALVFTNFVPAGLPELGKHFEYQDYPLADELADGHVRFKLLYLSVDPYMRGRMKDVKSYFPGFKIGEPADGFGVAVVEESKHGDYKVGSKWAGTFLWVLRRDVNGDQIKANGNYPLPPGAEGHESLAVGALGMPGMTAYFATLEILKPKEGETAVVSGAAGAVGSLVVQILKIKGSKVVAIAGGDKKVELLKEIGADEVVNYKTAGDIKAAIAAAAPKGVDTYFDNVGGEIKEAAVELSNTDARIAACGSISTYNLDETPLGKNLDWLIITRQLLVQGFIVTRWLPRWGEGFVQMAEWIKEGKIRALETVLEGGLDDLVSTFNTMMTGGDDSLGKVVLKVTSE